MGGGVRRNRWTDDDVFECLKLAATYEYPLSTSAYNALVAVGEIDGPSASRIGQRFGTWMAACDAAGIEAPAAGPSHTQPRWTNRDLLTAMQRFLSEGGGPLTTTAYNVWRQREAVEAPSSSLLGTRFGSWNEAKRRAEDLLARDSEVRV